MKKIVASVGLVALGASGLNTLHGQNMAATPYKPWNVSASLRGFYDDNINTVPDGSPQHQGSAGYELSPALNLNWQNDQTTIMAGYAYTLRWYEKKPFGNTSHYDQDHTFNGELDHAFTERYRVGVRDSFVLGQEPDVLRSGYAFAEPQRVPGDNIRNYGAINFDARFTPLFAAELGYANNFYHYHNTEKFDQTGIVSLGALLNRIEHTFHLDGRWQLMPQTVGVLGYQYSQTDYTGNDFIEPSGTAVSKDRNSRAHYVYAGADHNFLPDLSGSLRLGIRSTDYYNSLNNQSDVSPYVMANLRYNYAPQCFAEIGFNYDRNATSVTSVSDNDPNDLTLDVSSAVIYGSIKHQLTPKLYANLVAQYQDSTYNGGSFDGKGQQYFLFGLDLQYRFTPNLAANAGYNYDKAESDVAQSYDRNRVYIGMTISY